MFIFSPWLLDRANRLDFDAVQREVEKAHNNQTWFAWQNLCDIAYVGLSRCDKDLAINALHRLCLLFKAVCSTTGGKHHNDVRSCLEDMHHHLLHGSEDGSILYRLGQLCPVIAEIETSLRELPADRREWLETGMKATVGPKPDATAAA